MKSMKRMQNDIAARHNPHGWPRVVASITGVVFLARNQEELDRFRRTDHIALAIGFALAAAVLAYVWVFV